ncbi:MAG: DUF4783 domain-containing protein [Bacteroidales bacterium]|nr:DUF4783 domain-containing protein [Bacteroidales bacterium]
MKTIIRILAFTIAILVSGAGAKAGLPEEIITGFRKGDAEKLSAQFNHLVQMVVLEQDNIFSKAQAKQILTNFFSRNKVSDFQVLHEGGKDDANFTVGILKADTGEFRVYLYRKTSGKSMLIHQLRIEKDKGKTDTQ